MGFLPDVLLWTKGPVGRSAPAHSHAGAGPTVPAVGGVLSAAGRWHRPPALSSAGSAAGPAAGEGWGKTGGPGGRRVLPGETPFMPCAATPHLPFFFFHAILRRHLPGWDGSERKMRKDKSRSLGPAVTPGLNGPHWAGSAAPQKARPSIPHSKTDKGLHY